MNFAQLTKGTLALALSGTLILSTQMATMAQAEILSTDTVIAKYGQHTERNFLLSELQKSEVRDQLIEMGVKPAEVESRLAALSDAEIRSLLMQFEADNAGGEPVLSTLLTVFVILLVTDFLCLTKIFKFTRCL